MTGKYPVTIFDDYHRKFYHNKKGVSDCINMWGEMGGLAACIHIARDLCGYVPKEFTVGEYLVKIKGGFNGSIHSSIDWSGKRVSESGEVGGCKEGVPKSNDK